MPATQCTITSILVIEPANKGCANSGLTSSLQSALTCFLSAQQQLESAMMTGAHCPAPKTAYCLHGWHLQLTQALETYWLIYEHMSQDAALSSQCLKD